jgi:hypothetical protein
MQPTDDYKAVQTQITLAIYNVSARLCDQIKKSIDSENTHSVGSLGSAVKMLPFGSDMLIDALASFWTPRLYSVKENRSDYIAALATNSKWTETLALLSTDSDRFVSVLIQQSLLHTKDALDDSKALNKRVYLAQLVTLRQQTDAIASIACPSASKAAVDQWRQTYQVYLKSYIDDELELFATECMKIIYGDTQGSPRRRSKMMGESNVSAFKTDMLGSFRKALMGMGGFGDHHEGEKEVLALTDELTVIDSPQKTSPRDTPGNKQTVVELDPDIAFRLIQLNKLSVSRCILLTSPETKYFIVREGSFPEHLQLASFLVPSRNVSVAISSSPPSNS